MTYFPTPIITNGFCKLSSLENPIEGFTAQRIDRQTIALSNIFQMISFPILTDADNTEIAALKDHLDGRKASYERLKTMRKVKFSQRMRVDNAYKEAQAALTQKQEEIKTANPTQISLAVFDSNLGTIGFFLRLHQAASLAPLSSSHIIEINHTDWRTPTITTTDPFMAVKSKPRLDKPKLKVS